MEIVLLKEAAIEKNAEVKTADEMKTQEIEKTIVDELSNFVKNIHQDSLSDFLAKGSRYISHCMKLPEGETKSSRWGKVYTNLLQEALKQFNKSEEFPYSIKIEDNKRFILDLIESDKYSGRGYYFYNTFVVYLVLK